MGLLKIDQLVCSVNCKDLHSYFVQNVSDQMFEGIQLQVQYKAQTNTKEPAAQTRGKEGRVRYPTVPTPSDLKLI